MYSSGMVFYEMIDIAYIDLNKQRREKVLRELRITQRKMSEA
jgi:hypothetical protein